MYLQDNRTKTGGKTVLHPGFQVRFLHNLEITTELLLKWADLKRALKKWHVKLAKVRKIQQHRGLLAHRVCSA